MMSFEAARDLQVRAGLADGGEAEWQSNLLVSEPGALLERRWISIPRNVWHQVVVPEGPDWVVVSFHSVVAGELIEERPDDSSKDGTKQMKYLARK